MRVDDISSQNYVERDLMLLKVKAPPAASAARSASWSRSSAARSSTSVPTS